jgi:WD40 repeat protein
VRPSNELGARNSQNPGLVAVIGLLRTLEGHALFVKGVAVTGDVKRAVSASGDSTLKVWDLETGQPAATFHCDASAGCCAFADNQKIIAGDYGGRLHFLS